MKITHLSSGILTHSTTETTIRQCACHDDQTPEWTNYISKRKGKEKKKRNKTVNQSIFVDMIYIHFFKWMRTKNDRIENEVIPLFVSNIS